MSRQRKKGTAFETAVLRYLAGHQPREVERVALHGSRDRGDLVVRGTPSVAVECKDVAGWGPALLREWQVQTAAERANAGADAAVLVVHRRGCGARRAGRNLAWMTLGDALTLAGPGGRGGVWVCVELSDVARMLGGGGGE